MNCILLKNREFLISA